MVGRRLVNRQAKEVADSQRVGSPPRDSPLRAQTLEVPEQEDAEVPPRRQAWPTDSGRIEALARAFDEGIEAMALEEPIQALMEGMPWAGRQVARGNSQHVLPPFLPLSHGHDERLRSTTVTTGQSTAAAA
jgi:hypothetical protein